MIPEAANRRQAVTHLDVIRERARKMGMLAWRVGTDGTIVDCPPPLTNAELWIRSSEVESLISEFTKRISATNTDTDCEVIAQDVWLVPIPIKKRRRVSGYIVCAALGKGVFESGLFETWCHGVAVSPQAAKAATRSIAKFDARSAEACGRMLRWMAQDLSRLDESSGDADDLTRELTNAYETIDLLYEVGGAMSSLREPERFVEALLDRMMVNQGFSWALLSIETGPEHTPLEVRRGSMPCADTPSSEIILGCESGLNGAHDAVIINDLRWQSGQVTPQSVARQISIQGERRGVLIVGDKNGADPQVSSYDTRLIDTVGGFVAAFFENEHLYSEQRSLFRGSLAALTRAIDAKDAYTRGHSERVAHLSVQIAKAIGLSEEDQERLWIAGLIHDVGKIGVPEAVLTKPGRLTDDEFGQIKRHPEIGREILEELTLLDDVRPAVLSHHERWDGGGYPQGISGETIPLFARIVCLADTFDAMSSNRSYRSARPREAVLEEIERCAGTQFDPEIARAFERVDLTGFDELIRKHKSQTNCPEAEQDAQNEAA